MAIIGLIRHGITDLNLEGRAQGLSDIPLNVEGRQQAVKLAQKLQGQSWDLIISSHLCRARETAEIIAASTGITELVIDDRIREMDCGLIDGMTESERTERWGEQWRDLELGMEKLADVSHRGSIFLEDTYRQYYAKKVLVVSHGALIGLTLQQVLPHIFTSTYIDNTSLTLLTKVNNSWDCPLYNCTDHLLIEG